MGTKTDEFQELLLKIKHGERTRALFDMLMDHLKADPNITGAGLFSLMKESILGESKAQEELMKMTKPGHISLGVSSSDK